MLENWDKDKLDKILEEVAQYHVDLVEDPTLPELGFKYMQKIVSSCRNYTNRVMYYLQTISAEEKRIRRELKILELDLDLKLKEKLADDDLVRRQSSIDDRKALASSMLSEEIKEMAKMKVISLDLEETIKILKMKYNDLQKTAIDIRLQRQMVKDEKESWERDGEGFSNSLSKDRKVPGGMPPALSKQINPIDLLNDETRPDDLPKPVDEVHAKQIASFLNSEALTNRANREVVKDDMASLIYDDLIR